MSVKAKLTAGAATFVMVGGGLGMAGTLTASAATPSCGNSCVSLYTQKFGQHYYVDVYQHRAAAGQESILFQASNSDPALDFTYTGEGTVHDFYKRGLVTAAFDKTYANDQAFELQYAPYGRNSGFCLSTWPGVTAEAGYKVRLETCGKYSNSIWAVDAQNAVTHHHGVVEYAPLINGATNTFSNPLVLNYPAGNPTDMPRPVLNVQQENTYSNGTVFDNQEWGYRVGVIK
jgi:hypothetical protein